MKKILLASVGVVAFYATPAFAADYPVKTPPAAMFSWSGWYVGGDIGGVRAKDDVSPTTPDGGAFPRTNTVNSSGVIGSGILGYNIQSGNAVFGIEGNLGGMGIGISKFDPGTGTEFDHLKSGLYADVTGRLGFAADKMLFYVKGGWAWFDGKAQTTTAIAGFTPVSSSTFSGWVFGGGTEYAFAPAWSVKWEYLHYDLGHETAVLNPGPIGYRNKLTADAVTIGLNYHFASGRY